VVPTVSRICNRYAVEGLHAALEEKTRPGAIPKITGEIEAKIMLLACSEPPRGAARWTLSLLKNQVIAEGLLPSVGRTTLGDRLKKMRSNLGRSRLDFAGFLKFLSDEVYPEAEVIVSVTDNLNLHKTACLYEAFEPGEARRLAERPCPSGAFYGQEAV
jgi:Homeodomain-like domain